MTKMDKSEQLYCICRSPVANVFMIMCDYCQEWYHGDCIGVTFGDSKEIDFFCCSKCHELDQNLKTTYKADRKKKVPGKSKNSGRGVMVVEQLKCERVNLKGKGEEVATSERLGFVDTTTRKAKTEANQKMKLDCIAEGELVAGPSEELSSNAVPWQCYGPSCIEPSREWSKYCSDACGKALASHRILEVLPARVLAFTSPSPVADERDHRRLGEIRREMQAIALEVEGIDSQIVELLHQIGQTKLPGNEFRQIACEDPTPMECVLCGAEVHARTIERHLEACYRRLERKIITAECADRPEDGHWNVFCNQEIGRDTFCKKLRVLCPFHYKDRRREDEVCGYPFPGDGGRLVYCGSVGRCCPHPNWEEIARAELDLVKLLKLLRYNHLERERDQTRRQLAARGDLLSLMMNHTIAH